MNINNPTNQAVNKGDYAMQLPVIQEHNDFQQAVDAKELHRALGLHPAKWSEWSKHNIANNPFALEGTDYGVYNPELNTQGGRPTTNYLLSVNFAKKLAMQVRTEKGEQVRDYFLECERKAKQTVVALPDFTNPADAAIAWAEQYKAKQAAQEQLAIAQPKAEALDIISHAKGSTGIRETSKIVGLGQNAFVNWCLGVDRPISSRFLYRDMSGALNAYQHRINQGFMTQKINCFAGGDGRDRIAPKVKFTSAGIAQIAKQLKQEKAKSTEVIQ